MTRRNDLAVAIMAGTLVSAELKLKAERSELVEIMSGEDIDKATVKDAEGNDLGTASLCDGKPKAKLVDEAALLTWVKKNRPEQVREIVEPAYIKALLKQFEADGDVADKTTGEAIPGFEMTEGSPYVRVTPNEAAKDRMADLVRDSGLLQLGAAPAAEQTERSEPFVIEGLDDEEPSPW